MYIRKLQAVFGGLQGAELELNRGFNLLESGNETGKSTWSRFIRAMFYGISPSERAKQGSLPDRLRYLPWSGAPMQGRMELEWQGREVTLTRVSPAAGKPMGLPSAVLTGTAEKLPELQGTDAGELLLGVTEAVFRRSAFLSGSELRIDPDRDLERRLMTLVTAGEELSSCQEAEDRLRRWRRKRRWRNSGSLPEAERALEEKANALRRMEEGTRRLSSLRLDLERLEAEREALRMELRLHRRDDLLELRRRWAAAELEAREQSRRAEELETLAAGRTGETADDLRAAVLRLREAEKDREALEKTLLEAGRQAEELPRPSDTSRLPGRGPGLAFILLGVLAAGFGALGLLQPALLPVPSLISRLLLACILLLIPGILRLRNVHRREESLREDRRIALERANARLEELERQLRLDEAEAAECRMALERKKEAALCGEEEDPMAAADRLDGLLRELEAARTGAASAARLAESLAPNLEEQPEELEGETTMPREEAERRLQTAETTLRETERVLAREEAVYGLLGDPLVLASQAKDLEESIRSREAEYAALDLAEQALEEAGRQMQSRFAPLISREAGQLLKGLTGGRYTGLTFDRDLRFYVQPAGDLEPRGLEYLSEGTKNQVWLAARLAICRLALPGEDPCPLILDDVLLTFDDERARRALEVLLDLAKERQILLFTCTGRERELLSRMGKEEQCLPQ